MTDSFTFADCEFDPESSVASFTYELTGDINETFTERIYFQPNPDSSFDLDRLHSALTLLGSVLGLSYYKLTAPSSYEISVPFTRAGVDFLQKSILYGMAEFAYRNKLKRPLTPTIVCTHLVEAPNLSTLTGSPLVPIGGGKDSVVTVELLKQSQFSPIQFAVNPNRVIHQVAEVAQFPLIQVHRKIDPKLFDLNSSGALNGHVPVTAMNSLIAVAQSVILGLGPVVMSNESSSSDPTLMWGDFAVNHQWSKGLEAEVALNVALKGHLGLENSYFSLLRPYGELSIARRYAQSHQYDEVIVSCNRAFVRGVENPKWCGDCAKCRFIFLAFATCMDEIRLINIFGKNMFEDSRQIPGFLDLLGAGKHKPFECVGEEAECTVAFSICANDENWGGSLVIQEILNQIPELIGEDLALKENVFELAPSPEIPEKFKVCREIF